MKKFISVFMFVLGFFSHIEAQDAPAVVPDMNPNAPDIRFESEVVDYGVINYDVNGIREFKFTNTGRSPLLIISVTPDCGCISSTINGKPGWPTEPILPGKSGVIRVKYDTKREGRFDKTITVNTNAKFASKKIRIKGEIKPKPATIGN